MFIHFQFGDKKNVSALTCPTFRLDDVTGRASANKFVAKRALFQPNPSGHDRKRAAGADEANGIGGISNA